MYTKLDKMFLKQAYEVATESDDLSTQNGAILVKDNTIIAAGFNTIYPGFARTPERFIRPAKYTWTEHSERTALAQAAREGRMTHGSHLYCTWFSCAECARMCIWAGIERAVFLRSMVERLSARPDWAESLKTAYQMFEEARVTVDLVDEDLGVTVKFNGENLTV